MLKSAKEIIGYAIKAQDGEIGICQDFLFDDDQWTIRYLVAKTEKWLSGRQVLISPRFLGESDWATATLKVNRTRAQIESSPEFDLHAPVSREYETAYHDYYALPYYWVGTELWGEMANAYMRIEGTSEGREMPLRTDLPQRASNLQLLSEVTGYHVAARDRKIGHLEDFIVDENSWQIRFLVIDTRNWLPAPKVILKPQWFEAVDWNQKSIVTQLSAEQIKNAPKYDPRAAVNHRYELSLYDYYGRPVK